MKSFKKSIKFKNIFFDFDGVLAESVSAKTEAFRSMYQPYGEDIANKVVQHHIAHGGVSRFEKFKIYHKEFLNEEITNEKVNNLAKEFSEIVMDKVTQSQEVNGASHFLKKYSDRLNFWIITGTPTVEIKTIAEKRNISDYFIGIHGSPENKIHWTEWLINTHNLNRAETLFLGDATTDQDAATYSEIEFFLRDNMENASIFRNYQGSRFSDFYELEEMIKNFIY